MSDPVSAARSARENLRQGLAALQAPGIPHEVTQAAEPVAQAMGALHQIEASGGAAAAQHAPVALDAVRRALSLLQAQPPNIPAVNQALEAVAGSLSVLHQLTQNVVATAATQMQQPSPVAQPGFQAAQHQAPQQYAPAPAPQTGQQQAWGGTHVMQPTGAQPAVQAPPQYAQQPVAPAQPAYQQAVGQYAPQPHPMAAPQPATPQAPAQGAFGAPPGQWQQPQAAPTPAQGQAPFQQASPQGPAAAGAPIQVEAELGAHSVTNFYKGLSGNDVIDSGGIFIATYQLPEIGQPLIIKVSLPGGYEFEAAGVVRWTRETPHSTRGVESPPGFGAQFTNISQEGRQLVYRYVRNREPLFHDDL